MNSNDDRKPYLPLLLLGAIGLTALLLWVSNLTAGPEYGGTYDVPAINGAAWFGFCISAMGAFLLAILNLARLGEWVESGRRSGGRPARIMASNDATIYASERCGNENDPGSR